MRIDTIFKYHFPFEYWTLSMDIEGDTTYTKVLDSVGLMIPSGPNNLSLICEMQLAIPMQVRNLRDRSGNVITQVGGVPYPMYVHTAEPQLDPFSNVIAWRHTLKREPPRDYAALIEAATP